MSIALARRYRPRRFADLLVQDHVAAALRGAVAKNRVGHGYLLTGPRGVGKTTAARILAMALNCERRDLEHPTGEPCGECSSCERIWNGQANLDVVEIDAASNRGVDDARELRERAMYAASQDGHHKVYIVDEAHMLTREAWNALLKILEEPPPGVVFVFATTEPQKIFNTAAPVMSRLQRFDFRRIGPAAIQSRLREVLRTEGLDAEDDALLLIGRHADGGMRDALSVLDQCLSFGEGPLTAARVRDVLGLVNDESYGAVLTLVADRNPGAVFAVLDALMDSGADLAEFAGGLSEVLRALVMHHYGVTPADLPESTLALIANVAPRLAPEDAVRMLKLLADAEPSIRRSAHPRLVLETLLLRWAMLDRVVDLKALLAGQAPPAWQGSGSPTPPAQPIPQSRPAAAAPAPVAAPTPAPAPSQAAAAPSAPAFSVPQTTDGVRAIWSEVVATANRQSMLLGQSLDHASARMDSPGKVVLAFGPEEAVFREGAERFLGTIETILSARMGTAVQVSLESGNATPAPAARKGGRMTEETIRADRLGELRRKDPTLDAAADALDLELVDEG
ncbi:MAG: DNA polymerase III subunit gamma/tau [Gemmatimonadales bacterium]|nr:DNA polymerase III subunit gamma/tau [Gemmatimonadales bacterium]